MKYGKPIGSRFSFGPIYCYISKEIADCYLFIVIDVLRCFRILTSGFTSWLHDVLHCLVFKEHPRFPQSVLPALFVNQLLYITSSRFACQEVFLLFERPSMWCPRRFLPPTCNMIHGSLPSVNRGNGNSFNFFRYSKKEPPHVLRRMTAPLSDNRSLLE